MNDERLLYRDALMLVINKPVGVAVHVGPGKAEHLGPYLETLKFGLPNAPELAHRLDKDTSGCLVLGRHRKALTLLGEMFAQGKIEKTYWAWVKGKPPQEVGVIDVPLKKLGSPRGYKMVAAAGGMSAVTEYKVLEYREGRSWLELKPRTGRTHQLRVHCAYLGCPIEGDRLYGGPHAPRLMLHAREVVVPLYVKKPPITVMAEVEGWE